MSLSQVQRLKIVQKKHSTVIYLPGMKLNLLLNNNINIIFYTNKIQIVFNLDLKLN